MPCVELKTQERMPCSRCGTAIGNLHYHCAECQLDICIACRTELLPQGALPTQLPACPRPTCQNKAMVLHRVLPDQHQSALMRVVDKPPAFAEDQLDGAQHKPGQLHTVAQAVRFVQDTAEAAPSTEQSAAAPAHTGKSAVQANGHASCSMRQDAQPAAQLPTSDAARAALAAAVAPPATYADLPAILKVWALLATCSGRRSCCTVVHKLKPCLLASCVCCDVTCCCGSVRSAYKVLSCLHTTC